MIDDLRSFADRCRQTERGWFGTAAPLRCTRAPGRLDAFGGISDYTGGTVCEIPLDVAVRLAYQPRGDRLVRVRSLGLERHGLQAEVTVDLDELLELDYAGAQQRLGADPAAAWVRYVAGGWLVLQREGEVAAIDHGADVLIDSNVPLGAGVSSSAAMEVAALAALAGDLGLNIEGKRLARLGQIVENHVVGAPCGLMDQLTVTLGQADAMLVIRCQPDEILGVEALPQGVHFGAVHTGVKHSVGGGEYTAARVAAFMGHTILLDHLHRNGWAAAGQDPFGGYLARVPLRDWELVYRRLLPAEMDGGEFLARYGGTVDTATTVDPARRYRVAAAAAHHVEENARAPQLLAELAAYRDDRDQVHLNGAGALLLASHDSYRDQVGLGAPEADLLVEIAMERGPAAGVFGAKITGGGCGGSVAILGDERLPDELERIAVEYERRSGERSQVLSRSSDGVVACGTLEVSW